MIRVRDKTTLRQKLCACRHRSIGNSVRRNCTFSTAGAIVSSQCQWSRGTRARGHRSALQSGLGKARQDGPAAPTPDERTKREIERSPEGVASKPSELSPNLPPQRGRRSRRHTFWAGVQSIRGCNTVVFENINLNHKIQCLCLFCRCYAESRALSI